MSNVSTSRTVTSRQLVKALRYCIRAKRPAFITGSPGIGKSDIVAAICRDMGGLMYDMRLSQVEQTDLRGMPFFNKETGRMEWAPPIDLPDEETCAKFPITFLFLDELTSAPPSVQGAAYQLILNRRVGTYKLPDNCVVIAAGNKDTDRGVTHRMPTPLANRFIHFELRVDFDSWHEWAVMNKMHAAVVGFLNFSKNSLCDFDPKTSTKAFSTPRSWEFVSQLLDDNCDEDTEMDLISGTVGEGMALKFATHRKFSSKLPNPSDILSGKVTTLEIKEVSAMYSLATSLAYELDEMNKDNDVSKADWAKAGDNALKYMMDNFMTEITVMSMATITGTYKLPFDPKSMTHFKEFVAKHGRLLVKSLQVTA